MQPTSLWDSKFFFLKEKSQAKAFPPFTEFWGGLSQCVCVCACCMHTCAYSCVCMISYSYRNSLQVMKTSPTFALVELESRSNFQEETINLLRSYFQQQWELPSPIGFFSRCKWLKVLSDDVIPYYTQENFEIPSLFLTCDYTTVEYNR